MRKKSEEELRAANAARQKRWRLKHAWLAKQRKLAVYGKSEEDKRLGIAGPMTEEEGLRYEALEGVDTGYGGDERHSGRGTGAAIGADEGIDGRFREAGRADAGSAEEATGVVGGGIETAEERRVAQWLRERAKEMPCGGAEAIDRPETRSEKESSKLTLGACPDSCCEGGNGAGPVPLPLTPHLLGVRVEL